MREETGMKVFKRPSPNHGVRPVGTIIDCIVLHADASSTVSSSLGWIMRKESGVSYHFLIGRLGDVYECVPPERRAWHAGKSAFQGRPDCNNYSIGVSFSNLCDGVEPYRPDQIESGVVLCVDLIRRWPAITVARITTHEAVALPPGRKRDPGPLFPISDFLAEITERLSK
jgi:N-acetylmuramoyl-L-alanine amidase